MDRVALGTFLIHSGELPLIDELHSMLVKFPLSTVCHVDLLRLERTLLSIVWNVVTTIYYLDKPSYNAFISVHFVGFD